MAIEVNEAYLSRPTRDSGLGDDPTPDIQTVDVHYVVKGTDSEYGATEAVRTLAPMEWQGLARDEIALEPTGPYLWDATVKYVPKTSQKKEGQVTDSFSTAGGNQHVTQAKKHVADYAPPNKVAPNHKGAIGVTSNGLEGVDITVPVYKFSQTRTVKKGNMTDQFRGNLFRLTGKTNKDDWNAFKAGEVLFLGADGTEQANANGDYDLTYTFAGSPNQTDLTVGDVVGIAKKGWEYMWFEYLDGVDNAANPPRPTKTLVAVHIEQVYDEGDFSVLEPPTGQQGGSQAQPAGGGQ